MKPLYSSTISMECYAGFRIYGLGFSSIELFIPSTLLLGALEPDRILFPAPETITNPGKL